MTKLIKIYNDGCDPCTRMTNFLNEKEIEHESYNVLENVDLAEKYGIMSVPVLLLVDEAGNEISRSLGFKESEIEVLISQL